MENKANAFDLLRLFLAFGVVISHGFFLAGIGEKDPLSIFSKGQTNLAEFGVMGFFCLSGYLITGSMKNSENPFVFIYHRVTRIFPAYWVCLIITAFIISPLLYIYDYPLSDYALYGYDSALGYVFRNAGLAINQWAIKDVLNFSIYKGSLNGSLWSLFPEILCYSFTLICFIFGLLDRNKIVFFLIAIAILLYYVLTTIQIKPMGPTIISLSPAFKLYVCYLAGSILFLFRDRIAIDGKGVLFLIMFTILTIRLGGFVQLAPVFLTLILILGFQTFKVKLTHDISYGLYIYSFPIQQLLFQRLSGFMNPLYTIVISIIVTSAVALLSYKYVERPFIRSKKKFNKWFKSRQTLSLAD